MNRKILTLIIPCEEDRVLLGMKKRGFGMGRWNGFGGKVENGESVEQAARRELYEEAGIALERLEKHSLTEFEFEGKDDLLEVHIFRGEGLIGNPEETEEMRPSWFTHEIIPFEQMWPDDIHWFPRFLKREKWNAHFMFDIEGTIVISSQFTQFNDPV